MYRISEEGDRERERERYQKKGKISVNGRLFSLYSVSHCSAFGSTEPNYCVYKRSNFHFQTKPDQYKPMNGVISIIFVGAVGCNIVVVGLFLEWFRFSVWYHLASFQCWYQPSAIVCIRAFITRTNNVKLDCFSKKGAFTVFRSVFDLWQRQYK